MRIARSTALIVGVVDRSGQQTSHMQIQLLKSLLDTEIFQIKVAFFVLMTDRQTTTTTDKTDCMTPCAYMHAG